MPDVTEYAIQCPDGYVNDGTVSRSKRTTMNMRGCDHRGDRLVTRQVTPWQPVEAVVDLVVLGKALKPDER